MWNVRGMALMIASRMCSPSHIIRKDSVTGELVRDDNQSTRLVTSLRNRMDSWHRAFRAKSSKTAETLGIAATWVRQQ